MQNFNNNFKGKGNSENYRVAFKHSGEWCSGFIIDKFRGSSPYYTFGIDFYLIYNYELDETYKIPCGDIESYNKEKHGDVVEKIDKALK
jgi:hypothetical protein